MRLPTCKDGSQNRDKVCRLSDILIDIEVFVNNSAYTDVH